jgi:hypothetical protein
MDAPRINTAMPRRRYRLGDFSAVVLGEIDSADPIQYSYILALVREGDTHPCFYVTSEQNRRRAAAGGSHRMRVIAEKLDEVLGSSDRWRDLDEFTTEALAVAAQALGFTDEQPERLA